jgi:hypothetical protein
MNNCKQCSNKAGIICASVLHQCRVDFIHVYTHTFTLIFACVFVPYLCTIHNRRPHAVVDVQEAALFLLVM